MMTIKIEIGFDKKRESETADANLKRAAWLAAFADSVIWLSLGVICVALFYGAAGYVYTLPFVIGSHALYLMYLWIKAWFLTEKYGREIYRDTFGNMGFWLVAVSVFVLLFECLF